MEREGGNKRDRERGREDIVTVSVSVERVWRDIPLSHPLLAGGVGFPFPLHSPLSLLTSDLWLQLGLFLIRSQDSDLQTKECLLCPPTSVLHCLSHSLQEKKIY